MLLKHMKPSQWHYVFNVNMEELAKKNNLSLSDINKSSFTSHPLFKELSSLPGEAYTAAIAEALDMDERFDFRIVYDRYSEDDSFYLVLSRIRHRSWENIHFNIRNNKLLIEDGDELFSIDPPTAEEDELLKQFTEQ